MSTKLYIQRQERQENNWQFWVEGVGVYTASENVLTDSEEIAFVYLVDDGEAFCPIYFTQEYWSTLLEVIQSNQDPFVAINDQVIQLTGLVEQLNMLIANIEGNANYGEPFVRAVESSFQPIVSK